MTENDLPGLHEDMFHVNLLGCLLRLGVICTGCREVNITMVIDV